MDEFNIRAARLILVAGFVAVCLGSPLSELMNSQGKSCTVACLQKKLTPVCGSDGRTYKNPCMLNAQNCGSTTKVVEELYEGVCSAEPTEARCAKVKDSSSYCPEKIDPLCAEDQTTYLNYCRLLKSNCDQKVGIGVVHRGSCESQAKVEAGPANGSPVDPDAIVQTTIVHDAKKTAKQ